MNVRSLGAIDGSYPLFVALWASALFVHQTLRLAFHTFSWFDAAAAALFAAAAFLPRARFVLPAVAIVQLVSLWIDLPAAANHWVLAGFINLSIIATIAVLWWKSGRRSYPDGSGILTALAPLVRLELILVYLIAAFHKLNSDFLDPGVGCLSWVAHWTAARTGIAWIGEWPGIVATAAFGTVLLETAIPILLALPRTWFYGICLGVVFHLASLETGFTAVAIVLYFFFFPPGDPETAAQGFDRFLRDRTDGRVTLGRIIRGSLLVFMLVVPSTRVEAWMQGTSAALWIAPVRSALWIALLGVVCATLFRYFTLTGVPRLVRRPERAAAAALYVIPAVLLVNGMGPYLGLKTTTSFDMFSNLRVLGPRSNHLLLANQPLRLFGRTSDLVIVKAANDPALWWLGAQGPLPYAHFRREIRERVLAGRPVAVAYERRGRLYRVPDAAADVELMTPGSIFARKLLPLRREPWKAVRGCPW